MKCGRFIQKNNKKNNTTTSAIISCILILLSILFTGCSARAFRPEQLNVEGASNGVLNAEYAQLFWEEIVQKAAPDEKTEAEADYTFTLMEAPGENRRICTYRLSVEEQLLMGEEGCYRLTPDALALAQELAYPGNYLSTSAVEYDLQEGTYMVITAQYDDCILASLSDSPEIKIKLNTSSNYFNLGDKVTGDLSYCKKDGNRMEADCSGLYTEKELSERPNIAY